MRTPASKISLALLTAVFALGTMPAAQAVFITPGTAAIPGVPLDPGTSFAADSTLGGTVLGDVTSSFLDISPVPAFQGTLRSVVVQNSFGTLDFYFQIANTTAPQINLDSEIFAFAISNFGGFGTGPGDAIDVRYRTDGLTGINGAGSFVVGNVAPTTGDRDGGIPGGGVGFGFGDFLDQPALNIDPGETSNFLFIRTNATSFALDELAGIVTGAGSARPAAFVPVAAAVPEPATGFAGIAVGLLVGAVRRRKAV